MRNPAGNCVNGMFKSFADEKILRFEGKTWDEVHREAEKRLSTVKMWL